MNQSFVSQKQPRSLVVNSLTVGGTQPSPVIQSPQRSSYGQKQGHACSEAQQGQSKERASWGH